MPTAHFSLRPIRPLRSAIRAFTMMELLVVLAILGLLAGLAIGKVGRIHDDASRATARLFVNESMKTTLFAYRMSMSGYPSTADGLQALVTSPANKGGSGRGPYIEGGKVPTDPWGEPY